MLETLAGIVSELVVDRPACEPEEFRRKIILLQNLLLEQVKNGTLEAGEYPLRHYFTPIDKKYGCSTYGREIFIPAGHIVIGKIHKHAHLNFIMKGEAIVVTEFGGDRLKAPLIFVSKPATKRAVYAIEDTIWVTVHLTEHHGEENLDKMEDEVIAKTYEELGMIDSVEKLRIGEHK